MSNVSPNPDRKEDSFNVDRKEEDNIIQPDFILIDDRDGVSRSTFFNEDGTYQEKNEFLENDKMRGGSSSLRWMCVLGLVLSVILGFGLLLWSLIVGILVVLFFFQNKHLNRELIKLLRFVINTFVAAFCFGLGIITPTYGLGLLVIYFSLTSNIMDENFLNKILRNSRHRF